MAEARRGAGQPDATPELRKRGTTMDEQNATASGQAAAEANSEAAPAKLYATRQECEAAKPADASKALRPFEVSKGGAVVGWVLARGHSNAIEQAGRLDGWVSASTGKPAAVVTKEAVAAKLATFTDDELQRVGLTRKPARGGKK